LHEQGSVHTLKDRRLDLYNLSLKKEVVVTQKQ